MEKDGIYGAWYSRHTSPLARLTFLLPVSPALNKLIIIDGDPFRGICRRSAPSSTSAKDQLTWDRIQCSRVSCTSNPTTSLQPASRRRADNIGVDNLCCAKSYATGRRGGQSCTALAGQVWRQSNAKHGFRNQNDLTFRLTKSSVYGSPQPPISAACQISGGRISFYNSVTSNSMQGGSDVGSDSYSYTMSGALPILPSCTHHPVQALHNQSQYITLTHHRTTLSTCKLNRAAYPSYANSSPQPPQPSNTVRAYRSGISPLSMTWNGINLFV